MSKPSTVALQNLRKEKFFEPLTKPPYEVHKIMKRGSRTVVIWSDAVGFSVSYKDTQAQGTGGVHDTLVGAIAEAEARVRIHS
jgi:hypothetical protein